MEADTCQDLSAYCHSSDLRADRGIREVPIPRTRMATIASRLRTGIMLGVECLFVRSQPMMTLRVVSARKS